MVIIVLPEIELIVKICHNRGTINIIFNSEMAAIF